MSSQENAPHEGLFQKVFRDKDNTKHFLKEHLSQEVLRYMDLDSLLLENVTYIDDQLKKYFSDLVFTVNIDDQEFPAGKIYLLFEHKSYPDEMVALQILRYMALQWKDMIAQARIPSRKLPPIIPIVIYQGQETWKVSSSFQDMVDMPSEEFKKFIPDFSFAFFNIGQVEDQKVQENVILKFYVAIIKSLNSPELRDILPRLTQGLYESLERRTALEYIEIFFKYLVKSTDVVGEEDYAQALRMLPEGGDKIMNTLAEEWKREGELNKEQEFFQYKEKWVDEAKVENTQEMLITAFQNRFGVVKPKLAAKIRSIQSIESLNSLFNQIFFVQDENEFKKLVDEVISED